MLAKQTYINLARSHVPTHDHGCPPTNPGRHTLTGPAKLTPCWCL